MLLPVKAQMNGRRKHVAALLIAVSTLCAGLASAVPASATAPGPVADAAKPSPGPKAKSPKTNLTAYPKLTDAQLAARSAQERKEAAVSSETEPSIDVTTTETLADGQVRVDSYSPAPGVTSDQLADSLRKAGKKDVQVSRHEPEQQTKSDIQPLAASDCSYGQARSVTCPVSYWTNMTRANPVVAFNDRSGAAWPTNDAVYKWNRTPNIDSWYYWNYCPQFSNVHCVDVDSANYGATGWQGHTTRYYVPPTYGRIVSAHVELNDFYSVAGTSYNHIVTHELGHALGLGHNMWSGDLMYPIVNMREDIGGENPELLRSIYSIDR